jgi:hypothetical protein
LKFVGADAVFETHYADVGALTYYLKAIPWEAVGFSVAACADRLVALHRRLGAGDAIVLTFDTYLVVGCWRG